MSRRVRDPQAILPRGLNIAAICVIGAFAIAPVLYMVLMSVTPDSEVASGTLWPSHFAFGNYLRMWSSVPLASGLLNSVGIALSAAAIATAVAVGAAYCLTRFTFVGRRPYLASLVTLQSIPHVMLLLPLFMVFSSAGTYLGLHLIGTRTAVVITFLTFALPLATWVMVTYLRSIPQALEEAGLVDGLSRFGALRRIVLPLSWPGMTIALVFSFLIAWNDVVFVSVLTRPDTKTASLDLQVFAVTAEAGGLPLYGQLMGAAVICALPVVVLYLSFQRYLVSGLASGGVKG
jgi:ABC-type glycerol-3-phosphate transport system permease component